MRIWRGVPNYCVGFGTDLSAEYGALSCIGLRPCTFAPLVLPAGKASGVPCGKAWRIIFSIVGLTSAPIGACIPCVFKNLATFAYISLEEKNFLARKPATDCGFPPERTIQSVRLTPLSPD